MSKLREIILVSALLTLTGCDQLNLNIFNSILVVDIDAVAKAIGRQEIMQKELEAKNIKLTKELEIIASNIEESLVEEKTRLGNAPSTQEKQKMNELVTQASQQLTNKKQIAIQKSEEYRSELLQAFRNEVGKIAQQIASRSRGKLVLMSNNEMLWFDPSADITDEVIAVF
ncbi:MAG: OmpH family outer membrane protein [Gammaproteobacteria bacterium]